MNQHICFRSHYLCTRDAIYRPAGLEMSVQRNERPVMSTWNKTTSTGTHVNCRYFHALEGQLAQAVVTKQGLEGVVDRASAMHKKALCARYQHPRLSKRQNGRELAEGSPKT